MFKSLDQILIFTSIILLFAFYIYNRYYMVKKSKEYKNDERWQMISSKTAVVTMVYVEAIIGGLIAIYFVSTLFKAGFPRALERNAMLVLYAMLLKSPVEYLATLYYDKQL